MDWYIIQAYSNCEKKVKAALEERIDISGFSSKFGEIMIPTEQVTELKKGQKKQIERNIKDYRLDRKSKSSKKTSALFLRYCANISSHATVENRFFLSRWPSVLS